jgi:hypothetical protein
MLKSMKKPDPKKRKLGRAETVVAYEGKKRSLSSPVAAISKADAEANLNRMRASFEGYQDDVEGEKTFGPEYKNLGLKPIKQKVKNLKEGTESVRTTYRSGSGDEEVTRVPDTDLVDVKSIGEYEQAGLGGTSRQSIADYLESVKARKRAKAEAILKQAQPQREKIMAEIEAAKAKAGGNK